MSAVGLDGLELFVNLAMLYQKVQRWFEHRSGGAKARGAMVMSSKKGSRAGVAQRRMSLAGLDMKKHASKMDPRRQLDRN